MSVEGQATPGGHAKCRESWAAGQRGGGVSKQFLYVALAVLELTEIHLALSPEY